MYCVFSVQGTAKRYAEQYNQIISYRPLLSNINTKDGCDKQLRWMQSGKFSKILPALRSIGVPFRVEDRRALPGSSISMDG